MNKKQKKLLGISLIVILFLAAFAYSSIMYGTIETLIKTGLITVILGVGFYGKTLIFPESDSDDNKNNKS